MRVVVPFASRFGTTKALAARVSAGLQRTDVDVELLDVASGRAPPEVPLVLMTAIIWESPVSTMLEWLQRHRRVTRRWTVGAGVVCAQAGVKHEGGFEYAQSFAKRVGNERAFLFALSGRLPPRTELKRWEALALTAASKVLGYSFAELRADEDGAVTAGETIGRILRAGSMEATGES